MIGLGLGLPVLGVQHGAFIDPTLSVDLDFINGPLDSRIAVTRSGTATRVNESGLVEAVAANTARLDHDPVTLARRGLLVEESRANLALWSEDFATRVEWTKQNGSITSSATTAPDGSANGHKLVENTATSTHLLRQSFTLAASTTYTASIFAKASERTLFTLLCFDGGSSLLRASHFNLATGTVTQGSTTMGGGAGVMTALPNGWYRCSVTFTTTTGGANGYFDCRMSNTTTPAGTGQSYTGDGASGMFFFGGQLEVGSFTTSYIGPTTTASVTRAVDQVTVPVGAWFNPDAGTLYADFTPIGVGTGLQHAIYLDDATNNERFGLRSSGVSMAMLAVDGGATQVNIGIGSLVAGNPARVAMGYALNDYAACMNGGTVQNDTAATVPTPTRLLIGTRLTGSEAVNAHFRRARYFKVRKPDADVQGMTA